MVGLLRQSTGERVKMRKQAFRQPWLKGVGPHVPVDQNLVAILGDLRVQRDLWAL